MTTPQFLKKSHDSNPRTPLFTNICKGLTGRIRSSPLILLAPDGLTGPAGGKVGIPKVTPVAPEENFTVSSPFLHQKQHVFLQAH
jgi:hypothetical protein